MSDTHLPVQSSAREGATVLEVSELDVELDRRVVLHNVSFQVRKGTTLAVIGPNASGKTVLFRTLIGAIPFRGEIRWAPGARIGYVPQKLDIERDVPITGLDFLLAHPKRTDPATPGIDEALRLVQLPIDSACVPIGRLSGGQFQRLLIAFALVGGPSVLLLDEPTAGIDEPGQQHLYEVVDHLRADRMLTVILISHELSLVSRYATAVLCLGAGRTWYGPPTAVVTSEVLEQAYRMPAALHVHDH